MPIETLRNRARLLAWLITVPLACLCLLTILLVGNIVWQGGRYAEQVVILYLPMFLYMGAIWMVRVALVAVARGDLFGEVIPKMLMRVGLALFGGAVFTVFGVPLLTGLLSGRPYIQPFEASAVTLGIVGAALMLFSQLFERATAMRDELDCFI